MTGSNAFAAGSCPELFTQQDLKWQPIAVTRGPYFAITDKSNPSQALVKIEHVDFSFDGSPPPSFKLAPGEKVTGTFYDKNSREFFVVTGATKTVDAKYSNSVLQYKVRIFVDGKKDRVMVGSLSPEGAQIDPTIPANEVKVFRNGDQLMLRTRYGDVELKKLTLFNGLW